MKKSICSTIVLLLCVAFLSVSWADEILFRGIPWGTSLKELEDQGYLKDSYPYDDYLPYEAYMTTHPSWRNALGGCTPYVSGFDCTCYPRDMKVAGYTVGYMSLYCHYAVENGKINKSEASSVLYAADYALTPEDYEAAYANLKSKLSDLYGDVKETVTYEEKVYNGIYCEVANATSVWSGDNNTHVVLGSKWIIDESKLNIDSVASALS